MKYEYARPSLSLLDMELESAILDGSCTSKALKVNQVTVDSYDQGFSSTVAPNGFQDISFE